MSKLFEQITRHASVRVVPVTFDEAQVCCFSYGHEHLPQEQDQCSHLAFSALLAYLPPLAASPWQPAGGWVLLPTCTLHEHVWEYVVWRGDNEWSRDFPRAQGKVHLQVRIVVDKPLAAFSPYDLLTIQTEGSLAMRRQQVERPFTQHAGVPPMRLASAHLAIVRMEMAMQAKRSQAQEQVVTS